MTQYDMSDTRIYPYCQTVWHKQQFIVLTNRRQNAKTAIRHYRDANSDCSEGYSGIKGWISEHGRCNVVTETACKCDWAAKETRSRVWKEVIRSCKRLAALLAIGLHMKSAGIAPVRQHPKGWDFRCSPFFWANYANQTLEEVSAFQGSQTALGKALQGCFRWPWMVWTRPTC